MLPCERIQEQLPQYIADGEPASSQYAAIRAHLRGCLPCGAHARRLRFVEEALQAYPLVRPEASMVARIMGTISAEDSIQEKEWRLLPWDVWVPALSFALAVLLAMMFIPPHLLPATSVPELENTLTNWPNAVDAWTKLPSLVEEDAFWPVWSGIFAAMAGIGVSLSLTCWNALNSRSLDNLEEHVTDAAQRLWGFARRAH
jgi:hypothetical protein